MNATHSPRLHRRGFTLIELLVVIAIIAVLAAMGFGAGAVAINNARKLTARADATSLVGAVEGYFDEYNHLPEVASATNSQEDTDSLSDENLMNILLAYGSGREKNPKEIRYYQGKQAKGGDTAKRAFGGVFYDGNSDNGSAELFDAWKKLQSGQIRHYQVLMDTDYNEEMEDPFGTKKLYGVRVIAWSTGKDGEETRGTASAEQNRDNVYTWR
jgi:prepilin-type N-terminal cleavage/methylation domain-containing protein